MVKKFVLIVLDSVGIGGLPDAGEYGDVGVNTLANTAKAAGGVALPNMERLGLGRLAEVEGVAAVDDFTGRIARLAEGSRGKDTVTGHWELAGLVSEQSFATFPDGFPPEILEPFVQRTGRGILGNKAASGTVILDELAPAQLESGDWIVYTSADSVFQIAAHEEKIPLEELYSACRIAREILDPHRVARVISRPYVGQDGAWQRTYNRKDFAMAPPAPTVLDRLTEAGIPVTGVGKIRDIFSGQGVTHDVHTEGNADGLEQTLELIRSGREGLIFVNLVDFDMVYGHRRNPEGYARALEEADAALPAIMEALGPGDRLLLTADHGCDPTYAAHTDHTREYVPYILWGRGITPEHLADQPDFTTVAKTVGEFFGV